MISRGILSIQLIKMQRCQTVHFDWSNIQKANAPVLWKTLDAILRKQIWDFMQGLSNTAKIILDKIKKGKAM